MELKDAIANFRKDLRSVKDGGKTQVEIENLEKYLDGLEEHASASLEQLRREHESNLARYDAINSQNRENFKAVLAAGKEAINAAIIINGGGVIAFMTFMGNTVGKSGQNYLAMLAFPVLLLGNGVLFGGLAFGTRYISQFFYAAPDNKASVNAGHGFNAVSWLLTAGSFLVFAWAIFDCYHSLNTVVHPLAALQAQAPPVTVAPPNPVPQK